MDWGNSAQPGLDVIRLLGVLGVAGSFTIMITDWVGFMRPVRVAGKSYDVSSVPHRLASFHGVTGFGVSRSRTFWASIIGGLAMLPCGFGIVPLYFALAPAGTWLALAAVLMLAPVFVYGVISHTLYGLFADLNHARLATRADTEERSAIDLFFAQQLDYWAWFTFTILTLQALSSFVYSYIVFSGQTHLPEWMGFLNHFLLSQLFYSTKYFMPYSLARWLVAAHMHLPSTLPLLLMTTIYLWNGY